MSDPKKIVNVIIKNLEGRSGFDHWWDDIDAVTKREIRQDLTALVKTHLDLTTGV